MPAYIECWRDLVKKVFDMLWESKANLTRQPFIDIYISLSQSRKGSHTTICDDHIVARLY